RGGDQNPQPHCLGRAALPVEPGAHEGGPRATQYPACLAAATAPAFSMSFCAEDGDTRIPPQVHARARNGDYMRNSRLALPLRIFALSSSHSGTVSIHWTPGLLATKGQSTANRIRSMPISMTQHNSAGLEKLPLVVM